MKQVKGNGASRDTAAGGAKTKGDGAALQGEERRMDHIATAAYFRAQARGFSPGHELEDWLAAEAELGAAARPRRAALRGLSPP